MRVIRVRGPVVALGGRLLLLLLMLLLLLDQWLAGRQRRSRWKLVQCVRLDV